MWMPPGRDPKSLSAWFDRSLAAAKFAARRIGLLLVGLWLLIGALGWGIVVAMFDSDRGRELRRLLDVERTVLGPTGSSTVDELTSAEAERVWVLLQDLFWSALPWFLVLGVAVVIASAWSVAVVARAVQDHLGPPDGTGAPLGRIVGDALRRVPAVLASGVVLVLVLAVVWFVAAIPVVAVAAAGAGGAPIVLTAVFVIVLVVAATVWLWGRLALASVVAAAGGHGLGVRRSWNLTDGRFWFVATRLVLAGLISAVAGAAANVFNSFGQIFDLEIYLAIVVVLQALSVAVSTVITVCAHLVTLDQLDGTLGAPGAPGEGH